MSACGGGGVGFGGLGAKEVRDLGCGVEMWEAIAMIIIGDGGLRL